MKQLRPFFSIIIPTYNRPKQLAVCLRSLVQQEYSRNYFEVIVVDDGSEISMEKVVAPFREQINLILYIQKNAGPAAARNYGAVHAKGDLLAFTDDDCAPVSNWLASFALRFAKFPKCAITGRTVNNLPDNLFSSVSQDIIGFLYDFFNADPEHAQFFTSNNLMIPAENFRALGGFDTSYTYAAGEDRDLYDRWLYQGGRIIYAPEALVYHAHHLTLHTFWRQHFNYGRASFQFHQTRACRKNDRLKLESKRFYFNLIRYAFRIQPARKVVHLFLLFLVSQMATTCGFLKEYLK